ncbi:transporter substrate-binding domain-containing protein [Butyrivibrio sp. XPD2002]|uniref:transporter substrate-binding domain-containing protein n=1 Tax=Butyrivibrio sp. XPD2002 TaxID=1280665 RepID=UPI000424FA65|nr:transporter substrate-binding domain-containing protein [Butyrivibrio sp. XPD2002]
MKKNLLTKMGTLVISGALIASSLAGCGAKADSSDSASAETTITEEETATADAAEETSEATEDATEDTAKVYRTLDEIKESGTINIGVFSDKSPFGYVDENGEYAGYDVYFAEKIGEDLGVDINYVSTEAANRIEYLQTGKVDIILANFTVTEERAQEVDFALPYMNVALGVVSPSDKVVESLDDVTADDQIIVISGTTAETYLEKNYPDIKLQKYDAYAEAKTAFENGNGVAWANDNTEVIAFSLENEGYTVGIPSLGDADTIAPAVTKGNETLLTWLNDEIETIGNDNFFHKDYEATLLDTYGADYENTLVVEGGKAE